MAFPSVIWEITKGCNKGSVPPWKRAISHHLYFCGTVMPRMLLVTGDKIKSLLVPAAGGCLGLERAPGMTHCLLIYHPAAFPLLGHGQAACWVEGTRPGWQRAGFGQIRSEIIKVLTFLSESFWF